MDEGVDEYNRPYKRRLIIITDVDKEIALILPNDLADKVTSDWIGRLVRVKFLPDQRPLVTETISKSGVVQTIEDITNEF
jgi:hypothetical protein